MARKQYRNISVPESLYQKMKERVETGDEGYSSIAEYVREAIRTKLEKKG
jgi:Arc/MetJ-type ribon-helix-helix transcriptional regulator